jgi:hypothetical protein
VAVHVPALDWISALKGVKIGIHRSLLVSISPNSNLLPPLRDDPADVADAADETVEKEVEILLARNCAVHFSCWGVMMGEGNHVNRNSSVG